MPAHNMNILTVCMNIYIYIKIFNQKEVSTSKLEVLKFELKIANNVQF